MLKNKLTQGRWAGPGVTGSRSSLNTLSATVKRRRGLINNIRGALGEDITKDIEAGAKKLEDENKKVVHIKDNDDQGEAAECRSRMGGDTEDCRRSSEDTNDGSDKRWIRQMTDQTNDGKLDGQNLKRPY